MKEKEANLSEISDVGKNQNLQPTRQIIKLDGIV